MKSVGIVRKMDDLGRIVIPKEIRRNFKVDESDSIEIFTDNDTIILKKYNKICIFCGTMENLKLFKDKNICPQCCNDLANKE